MQKKGLYCVGWSKKHRKLLRPPDDIVESVKERYKDIVEDDNWVKFCQSYMEQNSPPLMSENVPAGGGACPAYSLREGHKFEVSDSDDPHKFWPVTVTENNGGFLGLSYDSPELKRQTDFRIFYLDERLHPCGTVAASNGNFKFGVPEVLAKAGYPDKVWKTVLQASNSVPEVSKAPGWAFAEKLAPKPHGFETNMLLTVIDPRDDFTFAVGIVSKVLDSFNFVVSLLQHPKVRMVCNCESLNLFSLKWSIQCQFLKRESLQDMPCSVSSKIATRNLFSPANFSSTDGGFEVGKIFEMYEGADKDFCVGKVLAVTGGVIKVEKWSRKGKSLVHLNNRSLNLFPIGWCDSNGVDLYVDSTLLGEGQPDGSDEAAPVGGSAETLPRSGVSFSASSKPTADNNKTWCPAIYFNHLCYSASFLSRHRLARLPKQVGPGPVRLVMIEVLSRLIGSSFKSGAVLKKLELKGERRDDYWVATMKGDNSPMLHH